MRRIARPHVVKTITSGRERTMANHRLLIHTMSLVLAAAAAACSGEEADSGGIAGARDAGPLGQPERSAAPAELRAAFIATVQAEATSDYDVETPSASAGARSQLRATNPAHRFASEFRASGVTVTHESAEGEHQLSMDLERYGCQGDLMPVGGGEPVGVDNRVELTRHVPSTDLRIVEWYVNGPLGLEQGFSLSAPPPCRVDGEGQVELVIALGGDLRPTRAAGGRAIDLLNDAGAVVLRYTDLHVRDASGRALPAELGLREGRLSILVDDVGASYPLDIDPLIGTEQQALYASDAAADDYFGCAVAVSGDTAVIGADGAGTGAAYVFQRSGATWSQQAKLLPSDGQPQDGFGNSVAINGDTIVVGTWRQPPASGAAYVFVRSGVWIQQQKLVASDSASGDRFGNSVAISGDTIVVGAPGAQSQVQYSKGAAYAFVRSGGSWTQQAKLVSSNSSQGAAVALSGDTAAIGGECDNGSGGNGHPPPPWDYSCQVHVFARSGGAWSEQAVLYPPTGPTAHYRFGGALSLSSDTLAVGTFLYNWFGPDREAAVVFARSGSTWAQQAMLLSKDNSTGSAGWSRTPSVALSGDTLVISGHQPDGVGPRIFTRSGGAWTPQSTIQSGMNLWGAKVALSGSTLLVGTWADNVRAASAGAAHVFMLSEDLPGHLVSARQFVNNVSDTPNALDVPDTNAFGTPSTIDWASYTGTTQGTSLFTLSLRHSDPTITTSTIATWWGSTSPSTSNYYSQIVAGNHFSKVSNIGDIRPGDLIVLNYTDTSSGHLAMVDEYPTALASAINPVVSGTTQYSVRVIDSTSSAHGCATGTSTADARWVPTTPASPCSGGSTDGGAGRGTLRLYAVSPGLANAGTLNGYAWSLTPGTTYYPQGGVRPHVVGRFMH
jgi:hypothetical protein